MKQWPGEPVKLDLRRVLPAARTRSAGAAWYVPRVPLCASACAASLTWWRCVNITWRRLADCYRPAGCGSSRNIRTVRVRCPDLWALPRTRRPHRPPLPHDHHPGRLPDHHCRRPRPARHPGSPDQDQ